MIDVSEVTLAVLAGGAGRRMGGPKAWLTVENEPIVARLHRRLSWPGPTLLISSPGRQHPPGVELYDAEVCDAVADQGPLRGIYTALSTAETHLVVVVPVDMPRLTTEPLERLVRQLEDHPETAGACYELDGRPRPLPAALSRNLAASAQQHAEARQLAVQRWFRAVGVRFIQPEPSVPAAFWQNVNEPSDLSALS